MTLNNKEFDVPFRYLNAKNLMDSLKHINNSIANYDDKIILEKMSFDDLDNILYRSEKMALSVRSALENKEKNTREIEGYYYDSNVNILKKLDKNHVESYAKNNPVRVEFDGKILKIFTPFTFKRMYRHKNLKENYILMNYVEAALKKWQKDNNFELFMALKPPFEFHVIRVVDNISKGNLIDHDNLENGRIANAIFDAIGYSDSPKTMDLHCELREKNSENGHTGMVFILKERDIDLVEKLL